MTTETLTLNPEQWIWINTTARIEGENEVPELYAKVLRPFDESGGRHLIHFTSVPPSVRARLNQLLDQSP